MKIMSTRQLSSIYDEFINNFHLFSGTHFYAINKPPDYYLEHTDHDNCVENLIRQSICGQLDYATSGVMLLARSKMASKYANLMIYSKEIYKVYLALLYGHLPIDIYHITKSICKPRGDEFKMRLAGTQEEGKPCHSVLKPRSHHIFHDQPVTLCELRTITGRRHQLRLHCASIGHPIVGDVTYFKERNLLGKYKEIETDRTMLHCWILKRNPSNILKEKYPKSWPNMKEIVEEIELITSPDSISKYVNQDSISHLESHLLDMEIDHQFDNKIKALK